ncbi:MAG: hypothetical protein ABDI19_10810 [Armatimonadota bacterium]
MAIETVRRQWAGIADRVLRPVDLAQQLVARLLGWFNQERWTNLLTILALVLANLVILYFLVQGQDNRAIAFVILALIVPLAFLIPEMSIVAFITAGSGMFVNAMYFAAGPGMGTGERTLILLFGFVLSVRAIYEYIRLPKQERPQLLSFLTISILIFWIYYLGHVLYIYIFRYDQIPPDSVDAILGFYRPGIFRYFDYHLLWVGIFPLIILLRDLARAKRVLILLGVVMALGVGSVLWEYLAPLPFFFKVLFQLKATGETAEGYRVQNPAPLYLFMAGFFYAIYSLGFLRGWRNAFAMLFILVALFGILITKNRILWAGVMVVLPFALLWKPPQTLLRQAAVLGIASLLGLAGMLHPQVGAVTSRVINEAIERWSRNYAYGGDPRLDPSYQGRVREREAWEHQMQKLSLTQRLFGRGLEAAYGRYVSLYEVGYLNPRFHKLYVEKVHMHFAWLGRMYRIGWIGTVLLASVILMFFIRSIYIFFSIKDPFTRAIIVGVVGATVGVLFYDSLHTLLHRSEALAVILMWAFVEAIAHWQRTGQLTPYTTEPSTATRQSLP